MLGHLTPAAVFGLCAGAALASIGCAVGPTLCDGDEDCSGGEVCSRDNQCADPASLQSVRLEWTVCGGPASVESCQAVGASGLRITFTDIDLGDDLAYEPVPCELGQIYFNRMGSRLDLVEAELLADWLALDIAGFSLRGGDQTFTFDFQPRGPTIPLGCAMLRAP